MQPVQDEDGIKLWMQLLLGDDNQQSVRSRGVTAMARQHEHGHDRASVCFTYLTYE